MRLFCDLKTFKNIWRMCNCNTKSTNFNGELRKAFDFSRKNNKKYAVFFSDGKPFFCETKSIINNPLACCYYVPTDAFNFEGNFKKIDK